MTRRRSFLAAATMVMAIVLPTAFPLAVAAQSIPALEEISDPVAAAHPELATRREALSQAREALHARATAQQAQCGSVEEGSAAASACASARDALLADINQHIRDSQAFNAAAGPYQCGVGELYARASDSCQAADRSPSLPTNLDPFTRSRFERELADLKAERLRAERELVRVSEASNLIEGGTLVNWRIRQDLLADSMVNAVKAAECFLAADGSSLPPATLHDYKIALEAAAASARAYAAAQSEPDSERQLEQTREALDELKNVLTEAAIGVKLGSLGSVRKFQEAFNELAPAARDLAADPSDQRRVVAMASALGDFVDAGEKTPIVGGLVAGANGVAKLTDSAVASWWWLRRDAADLQQAGSVNQTARLYWQARLGEIEAMQAVYKASLGLAPGG